MLFIGSHYNPENSITSGHNNGGNLDTPATHQFIGRTFYWRSTYNGADSHHHATGFMERVMNAGYSQDAADADNRIAGCNQDGFGILDGIEYAWCRACFAGTNKEHILDFVGAVTFDYVFLEVE